MNSMQRRPAGVRDLIWLAVLLGALCLAMLAWGQSLPPLPPPPTASTNWLGNTDAVRIYAVVESTNAQRVVGGKLTPAMTLTVNSVPGAPAVFIPNTPRCRVLRVDTSLDLRNWRPFGLYTNLFYGFWLVHPQSFDRRFYRAVPVR